MIVLARFQLDPSIPRDKSPKVQKPMSTFKSRVKKVGRFDQLQPKNCFRSTNGSKDGHTLRFFLCDIRYLYQTGLSEKDAETVGPSPDSHKI
jgi:hypothetical protein